MRGFFRQSAAGHAAEGRAHCVVFEVAVLCIQACLWLSKLGVDVYGGHNLPPLVEIGLRWLPKLGVDTFPRPHAHRRAWYYIWFHSTIF